MVAGALVAAGWAVAPALGAPEPTRPLHRVATPAASFGTFTPAAADPRLAAVFAHSGLDGEGFRFTPAETRRASRAVTVAVRSRLPRQNTALADHAPASGASVGVAPIAYNLGVGVGWKRFAIAGDLVHVDMPDSPASRETTGVGVSYSLNRITARLKGSVDRPLADTPKLVAQSPSYSVDVGGAYRLTHNLDVTAGLRYRMDRDRLAAPEDNHHDSQAVYVGTAFRF